MPVTALSFEVHLEPARRTVRLFLVQEGARVSAASGLVPKSLRELIQSQETSVSFEKDLEEFLEREGESLTLHLHTARGVLRMVWDSSALGIARTELDLSGGWVRIRKVVGDRNRPEETVHDLVRVGERLVGDLARNRLFRLSNTAGWYAADLLREVSYNPELVQADPGALTYEPDPDAPPSATLPGARPAGQTRTFEEISRPFEVTLACFNDKKIGYPVQQRSWYLKDLLLLADGRPREAAEGELSFRVTLERKSGGFAMRLAGACFWDGRRFDLSAGFFRYFDHLNAMRSGALRKKPVKKTLAEAALRLLSENSENRAEKAIELELAKLPSLDEPSRWEAHEYLRRFFRTFVLHEVENLLARSDGWFLVPADPRKFGALFSEVQALFGGELLDWLARQEKEVPLAELFAQLRALHARLSAKGIQLYYRQRPVRKTGLRVKVRATRSTGMDWFKIHPQIRWGGRVLSREEWRAILENQGALEEADGLVMLEESSLKTLQALRELMSPPRVDRKREEEVQRSDRLHILDWVHLRRLGVEVELPPEDERLLRRLLRFEKMESRPAPERLRGQLRDYQKEGYDWLAFLYEHGLGGCLADDMGLGKTVQAIAFLGGLREGKILREGAGSSAPHLVVVPSTLVFNWKREFENFYPDFDVREYPSREDPTRFLTGPAEVILTTYDIVRREQAFFRKQRFHTVIFDEAQYMKNLTAKRTASARCLRCDFVLTLTGTPLENHLGEYYSILDLSVPGLLGDYEDFRRRSLDDPLERLKKRAAPFVLRRTKDRTLKELPPKTETEVFLRMSQKQKALYHGVLTRAREDVKRAFAEKPAPQAAFSVLTALLRLRQICVSPKLLDARARERSPKIEYMLSKLRELVEEDHSALVFSQFTSFLDVLEEEIKVEKLDYLRMDGTTPKAKRKALVDAFQCGAGGPIFLISLKTGGVGLNLTRASYVFHLDPWWNPAVENQASDRVHRIGQKKNVYVTRLLMQHTVEEKIGMLKKRKTDLYRRVLEGLPPKGGKQGLLSREDFDFLLGNDGVSSARNNENSML